MNPANRILSKFEQISAVPRGTKQEARIRDWLVAWAHGNHFQNKRDAAGNLALSIPASPGRESDPPLILQGHLDMVWQKTPDSNHDFAKDPIRIVHDGDWIKADHTTLGADNGIAIAIVMALAEDESVSHPPLELLFTVEEEQGLTGAENLDPGLITAKTLINLDSEEEGVFTVGCAGGGSVLIHLPVGWENSILDDAAFRINVQGLLGGHSGGDIDKHRANANKLLARTLDDLQREIPIRLVSFKGGTARNAIPRDAEAVITFPGTFADMFTNKLAAFERILRTEFIATEFGITVTSTRVDLPEQVMNTIDTSKSIQLLMSLPNGVAEMSAEVEGFVETSNNIGIVETLQDGLHVTSNHRSSVVSRLEEISRRVESIAHLAGAQSERTKFSKPWDPNWDSDLLGKCIQVYQNHFGVTPKVELAHGGLECGIISERCGGMDTISLGPTIENPHSPDERLHIPSLPKIWDLLVALLKG